MFNLFCSYSHVDSALASSVADHLRLLDKLLNVWFDGDLRPTENWVKKISDNLDGADFVVLLLSVDYFKSEYCRLEMERALQFDAEGKTKIIPVALRQFHLPDAIAHIQTIDAGNPLADWPDIDAGCKHITEAVEEVVRKHGGLEPKNKLAHPNRKELARLLDFLCNRNPQYQDLVERAKPEALDPRRPFVIVTHGVIEDAHDRFLDRLQYRLLPEFLGDEAKRLSPLKWPDYRARRTPQDLFGPQLAACLSGVKPWAGPGELNAALQRCGPISLLSTTVSAENWGDEGHTLLGFYFQFWDRWPQLPEGRILIPILQIKYGSNEKSNLAMRNSLEGMKIARGKARGVVLRPFREIFRPDMEDWIRHEEVRSLLASDAAAIDKLTTVFPEDGTAWRMQPLAERHFPRFLSAL
ncbi:MAG TPA: TIR domain-containing protein [Bryobacteraceae bacterium]|jgi:hypothetical protein|nr:TIR domain-containing protein [Bryobacteraceae bacterium]